MFIEKLENSNHFEVGGIYAYAFACDSDSYHRMQVVSISDTRKTATIRDYYGEDREPEKTYRKKISDNYRGEETISAGNYSMAGSWYASERDFTKRRRDFDIDFMLRTEAADDLAKALADFPTDRGESVYTVSIEFFTKNDYVKEFPEISLAAAVNYLDNNADKITATLGKGWNIGYTVRKNGENIDGGYTTSSNPAALMDCIEADSYNYGFEQEYINILMACASEVLPADVLEVVQELADEIGEENETLKRAEIEMTSTDPDNDPTDPTPGKPDKNATYSAFAAYSMFERVYIMKFINLLHETRYNELLERSVRPQSRERQPIFYILAAFEDTYKDAERVYDFDCDCIRNNCTRRLELDYDSHVELIKLAFNLYNSANKCNICEVMISCGNTERIVAVEAIKIRYGMEEVL